MTAAVIIALLILVIVLLCYHGSKESTPKQFPIIAWPRLGKGLHVHWVDNDDAGRATSAALLQQLKPPWVRAVLPYDLLGGAAPNFAPLNALIALVETWGGGVILITPDYLQYPRTEGELIDSLTPLSAFITSAATNFSKAKVLWELLNEPNAYIGANQPISSQAFVAYCTSMHKALVAGGVTSSQKMISGGLSGIGTAAQNYLTSCVALGLDRVVDAIGVHPYGAPDSDADYNALRGIVGNIPIYATEFGIDGDDDMQAHALSVYYAAAKRNGIPLAVWYDAIDGATPDATYGLARADGAPKISCSAFQEVQ